MGALPRMLVCLLLTLFIAACGGKSPDSGPPAIRLVDIFASADVQADDAASLAGWPTIEWRFDVSSSAAPDRTGQTSLGWNVGAGVSGLTIRDLLLVGETTDAFSIIHSSIGDTFGDADLVHSVEVRGRISQGTNLAIGFLGFDEDIPSALREPCMRLMSTPLRPSDDMETYAIRVTQTLLVRDQAHILVRPSDVAGAQFELESVRIITLKEHLAQRSAAVGWYGRAETYMETIAARAPVRFEVMLQDHPRLDLALGTIEEEPVTFRIGVSSAGQENSEEEILLERAITANEGWQEASLDLAAYAGQNVSLTLSVDAKREGAVALWGNPVIRDTGASPIVSESNKEAGAHQSQSIILIMAEAVRRDRLSLYGYERETSPTLAQMASQGVLFTDCISQATTLEASAASILSSLYPTSHTVHDHMGRLPASAQTLAEVYRKAGYATLSLSAAPGTGQSSNLHQGFETLHESGSVLSENGTKSAGEFVDRLLPWIETHKDLPFFVFLHLSDPMAQNTGGAQNEYDDSIRNMDAEIGRVIEQLKMLGLEEKTVVAFVGAYGKSLPDAGGEASRGGGVYGELANVPLIITAPGVISGKQIFGGTVQTIDLMPTLLKMSGLEVPDTVQGTGLLTMMASSGSESASDWTSHPVVTEMSGGTCGSAKGGQRSAAIIVDGWKLVHNLSTPDEPGVFELYNHKDDPLDQVDVAADHPDRVELLKSELAGWRERAISVKLVSGAEAASDASPEELEQLRSLGYL